MRLNTLTLILFACLAFQTQGRAQAISATNRQARRITLDECVALALEQNLGLQVERHRPRIAQYSLSGAYGAYDPTLDIEATRSFSETEGTRITSAFVVPGEKTKVDVIGTSLRGLSPWGMTYELNGDYDHAYGKSGSEFNDQYDTDFRINLTQPLLRNFWIDEQRRTIKVRKKSLRIAEWNLRTAAMTTVRDVQVAYYDLIARRDLVKVAEKALELAERLQAENKRKVEVGTLAPLDEKQAEAEVAKARGDLIKARGDVLLQEIILKDLITDKFRQWQPLMLEPAEALIAVPVTPQRYESWGIALDKRPDFNAKKEELERQGIEVSFLKNQLFPELNIGLGYGRAGRDAFVNTNAFITNRSRADFTDSLNDIRRGTAPNWSAGAILSIPLSNLGARKAHREGKEILARIETELRQLYQTILTQVDSAITTVESSFEQIGARRQARTYAQAALEAEQKKLENGKSTSFQVLELQRDLTTASADEITALSEYNKALSELNFREGTILEKSRVKVE